MSSDRRLSFVTAQLSALAWMSSQALRAVKFAERKGTATQVAEARENMDRVIVEVGKAAKALSFSSAGIGQCDDVVAASALFNSLAEMFDAYWGDGDGQEPEPSFIIRARQALASFASAHSNGATIPHGSTPARQADFADANIISDAAIVRRFFKWATTVTGKTGDVTEAQASEAFNRLSFAMARLEAICVRNASGDNAVTPEFANAIKVYRSPDDVEMSLADQFRVIADRLEEDKPEKTKPGHASHPAMAQDMVPTPEEFMSAFNEGRVR